MEQGGGGIRLTARQVAERLGLPSDDAVWREARLGRIPHKRLGRRFLFYADAIEEFRRGDAHEMNTTAAV